MFFEKKMIANYILYLLNKKDIQLSNVEYQKLLFEMNRLHFYMFKRLLFDKWVAVKHGPVESDIYNTIENKNRFVMPKMVSQEEDFSQLKDNKEILEYEFETALANLQNTANNRISASTHTYRSYKEAWEKAQRKNRKSYPMSNETIKEETIPYYKKYSSINLKNLTGEEKEILETVKKYEVGQLELVQPVL